MKREIMINDGHDIEVVPSSCIIQAMLRLVGRIPEPTTVGVRGRGGQIVGTILIGGAALYILVHLVIWWVKP